GLLGPRVALRGAGPPAGAHSSHAGQGARPTGPARGRTPAAAPGCTGPIVGKTTTWSRGRRRHRPRLAALKVVRIDPFGAESLIHSTEELATNGFARNPHLARSPPEAAGEARRRGRCPHPQAVPRPGTR